MNNNQIIGENLKRLRSDRRLSLSQLAEACDVSKVVLSQIERGEANPTVNTIWKIAAGLKVPYTELLDNKSKETTIIHRDEAIEQIALDGNYKSYIYLSVSHDCVFDLFTIELQPGTKYESLGHLPGSKEYLLVNQGSAQVLIGEETYVLSEGDCFCFDGNKTHTYVNTGSSVLNCTSIVYY